MAQDSARTEDIQFVQPLSSYLKCHLCLDHLKEPQITPECGHTFCKECILRVFGKDQEVSCPLCRTKISLHQLHPNRSVEGLLNEQLVTFLFLCVCVCCACVAFVTPCVYTRCVVLNNVCTDLLQSKEDGMRCHFPFICVASSRRRL